MKIMRKETEAFGINCGFHSFIFERWTGFQKRNLPRFLLQRFIKKQGCHGIYENCLSSGDITCIMSVFLSKGHHPNCIKNIFNFSEPLLHSVLHIQLFYFGSENGIFFQN